MQALINRPNWRQQLRESSATEQLRCRQPDRFPLIQVQKLTNDFLQLSSRWSLTRREIVPFSADCDILLAGEIDKLKDGSLIVQAGVLACIHVFTTSEALAQLRSLQPDFNNADEHFDDKVALYLQCIIIAHRARPTLCSSHEALAAKELLRIVAPKRNQGTFPSFSKVLGVIGGEGSDLLPDGLIKVILRRHKFKDNLHMELEGLRTGRRWYEAYRLVKGIRPLLEHQGPRQRERATAILQEFFPHYAIWMTWRPSRTRIELWKDRIPENYRTVLTPVFDLEGPDFTGYQQPTMRQSTVRLLPGAAGYAHLSNDVSVLERILKMLDLATGVGPESIGLFIYLCIETGPPKYEALERLKSVLDAARRWNADVDSKVMKEYLKKMDAPAGERMLSLTQALPVIGRTTALQTIFGTNLNLKRSAVDTLAAVRMEFCASLRDSIPRESLGNSVVALGHAMLAAEWLHVDWYRWYVDELRQMPSHSEMDAMFQALRAANGPTRELLIDHLGSKVGNCSRRAQPVLVGSDAPADLLMLVPQDPIWYVAMDLDRSRLRGFIKTVPGMTPTLAVACFKRSRHEHPTFIRTLMGILLGCTDPVCVNLATFLGPRTLQTRFKVDDCWKALLLHMMRQQPPGMLERVAAPMDFTLWQNWEENMRRLFGDRHLDPHGGLGFTAAKISDLTRVKMVLNRSSSTHTNSSSDSDGFFTANTS